MDDKSITIFVACSGNPANVAEVLSELTPLAATPTDAGTADSACHLTFGDDHVARLNEFRPLLVSSAGVDGYSKFIDYERYPVAIYFLRDLPVDAFEQAAALARTIAQKLPVLSLVIPDEEEPYVLPVLE